MATFLGNRYSHYRNSGTNTPQTASLPSSPNSVWSDWRFRADIYLESQSTATNTSEVKIYFYIEYKERSNYNTTLAGWNAPQASYGNISINGNWKQISKSVTLNVGKNATAWTTYSDSELIGSVTRTISHNANGTGSFTTQCYGRLWVGQEALYTSNGSYTLPTIPRYATINSFTFEKASGGAGLSRLTCNWSVSNTCDAVEYSLSGGGWTSSGTSGTSGSFNISGLTPNTQYSLRIRVKRTDSQLWTESGTINQSTYDYAKITSAPNNNVDMDSTSAITYTNPSGASLQISLYKTDGATAIASYRACSGTGYTFTYSAGEKTAFYNQIPATKTLPLRFYLQTSDGLGNTYLHYVERTFEVFNANPTFTTWTYADTNATTVALTGSNQKIIKGYSNVKATITSANKMVANKGATATSYQLTIGTKPSATVAYNPSATVEMTVNAVDNNVFKCYAIDSRGNSTNVTKTITTDYINYTPISITSATATRTDDIGTETTLAFSGNIFDGSFGSVSNSVKTATYKFKKTTDASYTNGTSVITPTKTGGTFSFSGKIKGDEGSGGVDGFDATYSYNVQVIVTDELSTHTFNFILGSGTPNIAISQNGVAINQAYDETLGGALQVNGSLYVNSKLLLDIFYPVGTIYETTSADLDTTTKMGNHFGGTWEVYGSGRVLVAKSADTEFDTIGEMGGAKTHTLTTAELATHTHETTNSGISWVDTDGLGTTWWISASGNQVGASQINTNNDGIKAGWMGNVNNIVNNTGSGTAHNNIQPYIVVYRYRRVS